MAADEPPKFREITIGNKSCGDAPPFAPYVLSGAGVSDAFIIPLGRESPNGSADCLNEQDRTVLVSFSPQGHDEEQKLMHCGFGIISVLPY